MSLLKVFLVVFYIVHFAACMFFFIADIERFSGSPNMIDAFKLYLLNPIDQYAYTAYWALSTMTTVGYGDLYPVSMSELLFTMCCMLMACGVFAYIIGSLSTIIDHKSALLIDFK